MSNEIPADYPQEKFIPIEDRFKKVIDNTTSIVGEEVTETEYGLMSREEMFRVDKVLKKNYPQMLKEALIRQYVRRGKHLIEHAVEVAYEDNNVLIALLKKIVPDKSGVEVNFNLSKEDRELIATRMKQMVEERRQKMVEGGQQ